MLGEEQMEAQSMLEGEAVSQEEISHGSDNLSDYLLGETGAETMMGQW